MRPHRRLVTRRGGEWIRLILTPSRPTRVSASPPSSPNGILIGSAVFVQLTRVPNTHILPRYVRLL